MAGKNKVMKNFIGMGYYGTLTASNWKSVNSGGLFFFPDLDFAKNQYS
jgi:glycine cleavage system pyridoxal-binding protein P